MLPQFQRNDLLQLMVEASQVEGEGAMTYEETIADCLLVLLAGYDTSSNTLAFVTYLLAVHQDVQERLATEIGNYFQDNPVSGYSWQNVGYVHFHNCHIYLRRS